MRSIEGQPARAVEPDNSFRGRHRGDGPRRPWRIASFVTPGVELCNAQSLTLRHKIIATK